MLPLGRGPAGYMTPSGPAQRRIAVVPRRPNRYHPRPFAMVAAAWVAQL